MTRHTMMNPDRCDYFNHHSVTHGDERQEWLVSRGLDILDSSTPETPRRKPDPNFFEATVKKAA